MPPRGTNPFELYGAITKQAVALAEISNSKTKRILCMAITSSENNTLDGSPTSWSATIDSITSAAEDENEKRLFFISAGNVVGWWRERSYLGRYNNKISYSVIISLATPKIDVDLYTPIITEIESAIEMPTITETKNTIEIGIKNI